MKEVKNIFTGNISDLTKVILNFKDNDILKYRLEKCGQKSLDSASKMINEGCPEMFKRYTGAAKNAIAETYTQPAYNYSNEGLFFDVEAFLTGAPECWISEDLNRSLTPAKDICINLFAPWWVDEKTIFSKLIKIVALIDNLEQQGQRLNIKALIHSTITLNGKKTDTDMYFELLIKKDSEPINFQQFIYLMATPILLRFAYGCIFENLGYMDEVYNSCSNIEAESLYLKHQNTFYIPSINFDLINKVTGVKTTIAKKMQNSKIDYSNFEVENYRKAS